MKPYINIVGIVLIATGFFLLATLLESSWLSANLSQLPDKMTIDQWETGFRHYGLIGVIIAGITNLFWYCLCQWVFKIYNPQDVEGKGIWWLILFGFTIVCSLGLAFLFASKYKVGGASVYLCYVGNGVLCFYLSTIIFSAPAFRHIPWPAAHLRILFL